MGRLKITRLKFFTKHYQIPASDGLSATALSPSFYSSCSSSSTSRPAHSLPSMSGEDEAKPVVVKIIETVYVEADTADDFKSVVQRLTGKDPVTAPEQDRALQVARRIGAGRGGSSSGDRKVGSPSDAKQSS